MSFINPIFPLENIKQPNSITTMSSSGGIILIADYIDCIRKIYHDFPHASLLEILGSVRNLYYTGMKFSQLIPDSSYIDLPSNAKSMDPFRPIPPGDILPYWRDTQTLYKLKLRANENGQEDNPSPYLEVINNGKKELIDVGHLLLTFDALLHPATTVPYSTYGIPNIDIASWVADIAIAAYWDNYKEKHGLQKLTDEADFVNLEGRDKDALRNKMLKSSTPDDFFQYSAPESDLLGDIDGFVIKHLYTLYPNESLSGLFHRYYISPGGKFFEKRYWFFCFLNKLNYNYATKDWTNIDNIYASYLPRIDRLIDLFYSAWWMGFGTAFSVITSPVTAPPRNSYISSKVFLKKFLDWLKLNLQEELRRTLGNFLPSSGNLFP